MLYPEVVDALTEICARQAAIIRDQAYVLAEFGAEVREEEALALRSQLTALIGDWGNDG